MENGFTLEELMEIDEPFCALDAEFDGQTGGAQIEENYKDFYELKDGGIEETFRGKMITKSVDVVLKNTDKLKNVHDLALEAIQAAIDEGAKMLEENGLMGVKVTHINQQQAARKRGSYENTPIMTLFGKADEVTADAVLNKIEKTMQSNENFEINDGLTIKTVILNRPDEPMGSGNSRNKAKKAIFENYRKKYKGCGGALVRINNKDNLCLARAVVTGIAKIDGHSYSTVMDGDRHRCKLQKNRALALMKKAGLGKHVGSCGLAEIEKIEAAMPEDYQLQVLTRDWFSQLYYPNINSPNARKNRKKIVVLYLADGHFDLVTTPSGLFGTTFWCHDCSKGYNNRQKHKCPHKCSNCRRRGQCDFDENIFCADCDRIFLSKKCFDRHKLQTPEVKQHRKRENQQKSTCELVKRCPKCEKSVHNMNNHNCCMKYCKTCKTNVDLDENDSHECYMTPIKRQKLTAKQQEKKRRRYVFFDFETDQTTILKTTANGNVYEHKVIAAHARMPCFGCIDADRKPNCKDCIEKLFVGEDARDEFCDWLFDLEKVTAMAHNASGFDGQPILKYLEEKATFEPNIISNGLKLIKIETPGVIVLDSMSYLMMPLRKFATAFDIKETKKGFFPYKFTSKENMNYVGQLPAKEHFCPQSMKPAERAEFDIWYEVANENLFDFKKELVEYLLSDTLLLQEGCLKFRQQFMENADGIDPFEVACTIAAACMKVYKTLFLKPKTIGLVPPNGYDFLRRRQSVVGQKWLDWVEKELKITLEREKCLELRDLDNRKKKFHVDGYDSNTRTVYEFNGQIWHGCPCIKDRELKLPGSNVTVEEARMQTQRRKQALERAGYIVKEYWECCNLQKDLRENEEMRAFFDDHPAKAPMGPRDAFYGGRTNAAKLYHKCTGVEKIYYDDMCSLYPYVTKTCLYPEGHPTILRKDFEDLNTGAQPYFGTIKCKVAPPRGLLHPVLPAKINGKTMFTLCQKCAETNEKLECKHSEKQRCLDGCWPSIELYHAIEMGYVVKQIYEVWHYENTTDKLFVDYVDLFHKLKTESTGWPKNATSHEEKTAFLKEFEDKESIKLEAEKMIKNAPRKEIAKLCANSFWGKLGQRDNMPKTEYCKSACKAFKIAFDETNDVTDLTSISADTAVISYRKKEEFAESCGNNNPIEASFVTAYARLKLLSYLEKLGDRVLYYDTDSIFYLDRPSDSYKVPEGTFLGDMKNELEKYGDDAYISEFVSGGPKHYAYKVEIPGKEPQYEVKVKGIKLTVEAGNDIKMETVVEYVRAFCLENKRLVKEINQPRIDRTKDHMLVTLEQKKIYRVVYDKRVLNSDFTTKPFGY